MEGLIIKIEFDMHDFMILTVSATTDHTSDLLELFSAAAAGKKVEVKVKE